MNLRGNGADCSAMMENKKRAPYRARFLLLFAVAAYVLVWLATRPFVVVLGEGGVLGYVRVVSGMEFSVRFIHSVQKTPVEEFFSVDDGKNCFILRKTRYASFGVGLPFLSSDGVFRREGDAFVMDEMNRHMREIDLRPGVSTELTLFLAGQEIPIYTRVPVGSLVRVVILPGHEVFLKLCEGI